MKGMRLPRAGLSRALGLLALWVAVFLLLDRFGPMERDWGLDEGQRIAESYFWDLAVRGDVSNPDWFRQITVRSHPPVNKYLFGVAIQLHGRALPPDLELTKAYDRGASAFGIPDAFEPVYHPMRRPARRAALFCGIGSAVIVFALVLRWFGVVPALLSAALFWRHFLYVTLLFLARSDTVQTLTATATAIPLWISWRPVETQPRRALLAAAVVGLLAALSFQTRVSGLLALVAAFVAYGVQWLRTRSARPLVLAMVSAAVCFVVSTAINPYYWAQPTDAPGVPPEYLHERPLPVRIAERYWLQYQDLRILLDAQDPSWRLRSVGARARFVGSVLFSGASGMLIAMGILLSLAVAAVKRTALPEPVGFALVWGGAMITIFAVWIPLAWAPYVLLVLPAAILVASSGFGVVANALASYWRARQALLNEAG